MSSSSRESDRSESAAGSSRATVVLYHAPGAPIPPELTEALARQGSDPVVVESAYAALARVLGAPIAVLLLCEPNELPATHDLLDAVERYRPRVTRWEFVAGAEPPLRPVPVARRGAPDGATGRGLEDQGESVNPPVVTRRTPGGKGPGVETFPLRLAEQAPAGPGTNEPSKPRARSSSEVLTAEEMEALFTEDRR